MNNSALANQVWILDKEELLSNPLIGGKFQIKPIIKINESNEISNSLLSKELKSLSQMDIKLHTTGDLSHCAPENPVSIIKGVPGVLVNLLVLTVCWISVSFNKFLISFNLKHIPGNIFINDLISPLSDIAGFFLCIFAQKYTNTKTTYVGCFALTFVFGTGLIFFKQSWIIPILIVFAKIGISGCYSI